MIFMQHNIPRTLSLSGFGPVQLLGCVPVVNNTGCVERAAERPILAFNLRKRTGYPRQSSRIGNDAELQQSPVPEAQSTPRQCSSLPHRGRDGALVALSGRPAAPPTRPFKGLLLAGSFQTQTLTVIYYDVDFQQINRALKVNSNRAY